MLGKTSRPVMEILTGSLVTASRTGQTGAKTRMESNNPATRGLKSFDLGGVGLGIVAAMEKSGAGRSEVQANRVLVSRSLRRSVPNPVTQPRDSHRRVMEERILQDYSNVNWRGPRVSSPKGYSEGGRKGDDRTPFRIQSGPKSRQASVFDISPARYREAAGAPPPDFLNSCCLCRKKLHGKDIYMYRGEKAFCSSECRYRQIVVDERKEKCGSGASRSVEISSSPYSTGQAFNNSGILAA